MNASLNTLSPHFQSQYNRLRLYSFLWWGFYSLLIIFQPLYLVNKGFELWGIFLNGMFEAVFSFFLQNSWSKRTEKNGAIKEYMLLGNIFIAFACIFLIFVDSIWMLLLLTLILRSGPPSDALATSMSYNISNFCDDSVQDPIERKFHNINLFANYRKYGSIGWAFVAPFGGYMVNISGFSTIFLIAAGGFLILSLSFYFLLDSNYCTKELANAAIDNMQNIDAQGESSEIAQKSYNTLNLVQSIKILLQNKIFSTFMIASFFFGIATTMTYSTQGIFYGLFANQNYILVALTYSIAAFLEWPTMSWVAKHVKRIGWEKMVIISFIFTGFRFFLTPFMLLLNGNILWAYLFQISTGILFGIRLPPTTFGIFISLRKHERTLGQSFNGTVTIFGSFFGNLIGVILSIVLQDSVSSPFLYIYWIASIIAIFAGVWFQFRKNPDLNRSNA